MSFCTDSKEMFSSFLPSILPSFLLCLFVFFLLPCRIFSVPSLYLFCMFVFSFHSCLPVGVSLLRSESKGRTLQPSVIIGREGFLIWDNIWDQWNRQDWRWRMSSWNWKTPHRDYFEHRCLRPLSQQGISCGVLITWLMIKVIWLIVGKELIYLKVNFDGTLKVIKQVIIITNCTCV